MRASCAKQRFGNFRSVAGGLFAALALSALAGCLGSAPLRVAGPRDLDAVAALPDTLPSNWKAMADSAAGGAEIYQAVRGESLFVAVGAGGVILVSQDGLDWTRVSSGTTRPLYAIARGDSLFVAVGPKGTLLSSRSGREWTAAAMGDSTLRFVSVASGGTSFVAVEDGGGIYYSEDGAQWSLIPPKLSGGYFLKVIWGGSKGAETYIISFQSGLWVSDDGKTWSAEPVPEKISPTGIAWNGRLFVLTGITSSAISHGEHTYTPHVFTSPDRVVWTQGPLPPVEAKWDGAYITGLNWNTTSLKFEALLQGKAIASPDGKVWTYSQ